MRHPRLPLSLLVLALCAGSAPAAAEAATPFKALNASIKAAKPVLGRKTTNHVSAHALHAKRDHREHRWCSAVKQLGWLVEDADRAEAIMGASDERKAAAASVTFEARAVQKKIFVDHAKRTRSCGLPAPKVKVVGTLKPEVATIAGIDGGAPRPVTAVRGGSGVQTDFVENEVVLVSEDPAAVEAFRSRWKGTVLRHELPTAANPAATWLLHIETAKADLTGLPADLRTLDPAVRGTLQGADRAALQLIAITADAATRGLRAAPNLIQKSFAVEDRSTSEAAAGDAYAQWYNAKGGLTEVGEAWRTLKLAGKTGNRVKVAVVDGGISKLSGDFPTGTGAWDTGQNQATCSGGTGCPFHGTNVASTAGGVVDNGLGFAGTGGQVADIVAVETDVSSLDSISGVNRASDSGARVINLSWGGEIDAMIAFANLPLEFTTTMAQVHGALVVASAGNEGRDVDAEDCFIVCWEEEIIAPCENGGVLCVGGINENGRAVKTFDADGALVGGSNFGYEWTEDAKTSDVDLFAPFTVVVGPDPANPKSRSVSGTSFSSPFVAGVAAMMMAANPTLSAPKIAQGLKETASFSTDRDVSRIVNANKAVRWALPTAQFPPFVKVDPLADNTVQYGGFNSIALHATSYFVDNADPACCSYAWSSPQDGPLGTGATIDAAFSTPGKRTVTVTATNTRGDTHSATVDVEAINAYPTLHIDDPLSSAKLLRGQTYMFKASSTDVNELGGVACSAIAWTIFKEGAEEQTATGCTPAFKFSSNGDRTARAWAKDATGAQTVQQLGFSVVDPPLNAPPLVAIQSPAASASLPGGVAVDLKATAVDPDTGQTVIGSWYRKDGATLTPIGAGNAVKYTPPANTSCHSIDFSIGFAATDSDGASSTKVEVNTPGQIC